MKPPAIVLALACLAFGPPAAAQEIGRLFFTPEQRQALDARRKARLPDRPSAPMVVSPTTRLDGYVHRSGGKSTVFVNGEPVPEHDAASPRIGDSGRANVNVGESGSRAHLKPGEVLDRSTGEVRDVLRGGEIRVHPGSR
jgi:hypothetical protein